MRGEGIFLVSFSGSLMQLVINTYVVNSVLFALKSFWCKP
jgi:hypothetical protein